MAVPGLDVNHATVGAQSQARGQPCVAKREGHIVSPAKMLFDQTLQVEVGKDVAAVNDERLFSNPWLGILHAAAGFQEIRLVNQLHTAPGIGFLCKEIVESPGEMVGIDDEGLHANARTNDQARK